MRRHFVTQAFFPLEFDIGVDLLLGEDAALEQEGVVGFDREQGFAQAAADRRDLFSIPSRPAIAIAAKAR